MSPRRTPVVLSSVAALALLLGGCGQIEGDLPEPFGATASSDPSPTTTTSATPEPSATETPDDPDVTDEPSDPSADGSGSAGSGGSGSGSGSGGSGSGGSGDGGAVDLSQPPTSYRAALAHLDAVPGSPRQLARFASPNGNLYCVIVSDFAPPSCELGVGAIPAPDLCGDGPSQNVGRVELTDGEARPVCNSDTIREPGARTLSVGEKATAGGSSVTCVMETIGVTCADDSSEQGFFLGARRYEVFG